MLVGQVFFNHERVLKLVKCFFRIDGDDPVFFPFYSVDGVYDMDQCSRVKLSLPPRNESAW